MRTICCFLVVLLLSYYSAHGQEDDNMIPDEIPSFQPFEGQDNFSLATTPDCTQRAVNDIENQDARLLIYYSYEGEKHLYSGAFYANQHEFEEKYGITYKLYEITDENKQCVKNYNKQVFQHLRKEFGRKWKKEVRKDVFGLK